MSISKRAFLSGLLATVAWPAFAEAPTRSLRPRKRPSAVKKHGERPLSELIDDADLGGEVGFAVVDLKTGKLLESHAGKRSLPPASVAKAITALYALDVLGAAHRFHTQLIATGPIEAGTLQGDLILAGGGDPTLTTDHLNSMAKALAAQGIRRISGRFLVYGGSLPYVESIDGGQPVHVGYSPSLSGICLNFNRVFFEWKTTASGTTVSIDARSESLRPPVTSISVALSERAAPIYKHRLQKGREVWSVAQPALGGHGGRWLPVRQPEAYAGEVFGWLAARHGISLPAAQKSSSRPKGSALVTHQSDTLINLLTRMLKFSNNVTAEMIGLAATAKRGTFAASLRASGRSMATWADKTLGMKRAKFVDHSGLSDASQLSAQEMALGLARAQSQSRLRPILKQITMLDHKGRSNKAHPVAVRAKTGTLNFVSTLAGYISAPGGGEYAFAVLTANETTRERLSRAARERPKGARSWNRRARRLQQALIERWGRVYSG